MKKIIYDFGAARGENIPYYLLRSDFIVAVEADPENYDFIKNKFKKEIDEKKLFLENCIATKESKYRTFFYKHINNYLLGQFPKPDQSLEKNFIEIEVPSKDVIEIIKSYGNPYFIKIDVEQYDETILERILSNNIKPNYISVEGTHPKILDILHRVGGYDSFKLVEGSDVEYLYSNLKIEIGSIKKKYSFIKNSAGPFGNDIHGKWISKENFSKLMEFMQYGWRDIHCSLDDLAEEAESFDKYINIEKKRKKKVKLIKRFFRIISKLNFYKNYENR
jgi:FkbM family methyltransferase